MLKYQNKKVIEWKHLVLTIANPCFLETINIISPLRHQ